MVLLGLNCPQQGEAAQTFTQSSRHVLNHTLNAETAPPEILSLPIGYFGQCARPAIRSLNLNVDIPSVHEQCTSHCQ